MFLEVPIRLMTSPPIVNDSSNEEKDDTYLLHEDYILIRRPGNPHQVAPGTSIGRDWENLKLAAVAVIIKRQK
jgi:hypothetical protein